MRDSGPENLAAYRYVDTLVRDAMERARPLSLDSSVLIAYLNGTAPVAFLVARMLRKSRLAIVISTIAVTEAITRRAIKGDHRQIELALAGLNGLPAINIASFDQRHAVETAYVRAETGLKLPDAAIVATARLAGAAALLGNDRQWRGKLLGVPYHHIDDILGLA